MRSVRGSADIAALAEDTWLQYTGMDVVACYVRERQQMLRPYNKVELHLQNRIRHSWVSYSN